MLVGKCRYVVETKTKIRLTQDTQDTQDTQNKGMGVM